MQTDWETSGNIIRRAQVHDPSQGSRSFEQKTTILWKRLYLLASWKDSPGFSGAYERSRRGGEENPVKGQNTTVNVDKIRGFRP